LNNTSGHATQEISTINWLEAGKTKTANWHSENDTPAPKRVQITDDTIKADVAHKLFC